MFSSSHYGSLRVCSIIAEAEQLGAETSLVRQQYRCMTCLTGCCCCHEAYFTLAESTRGKRILAIGIGTMPGLTFSELALVLWLRVLKREVTFHSINELFRCLTRNLFQVIYCLVHIKLMAVENIRQLVKTC